jgi:hypothetical protein
MKIAIFSREVNQAPTGFFASAREFCFQKIYAEEIPLLERDFNIDLHQKKSGSFSFIGRQLVK